jgi:hypothetical protein
MKITQKILIGLGVVALTAGSVIGTPAKAQGGNLQWRSTTCTVTTQAGNGGFATAPCKAGFASDTWVRAIKFWDNGRWVYNEAGLLGATLGSAECLNVAYDDGGRQTFCTTRSSYQLGIVGD